MKHTEFWQCVDRAFPGGLGHGLVKDLVIPELDRALRNKRWKIVKILNGSGLRYGVA